MGSETPGGYSTEIIRSSLPGLSGTGFDISEVTFASCAITGLDTRNKLHTRSNMSVRLFIGCSYLTAWKPQAANRICVSRKRSDPFGWRRGSGSCAKAAEPFVETDSAHSRL